LKISIFGKNYSISTDESSENIVAAAKVVDDLMKSKSERASLQSDAQLAVIVALELATDLGKKKQQLEQWEVKVAALNRAVEAS
jgi:cell division protein ZapA (FtsZ GTPase activity inhibitor)